MKNALTKGDDEKRFNQLRDWFFDGEPTVKKCAEYAYHDLCRRLRGMGILKRNDADKYNNYMDAVKSILESRLEELKSEIILKKLSDDEKTEAQKKFDKWHKETRIKIIECWDITKLDAKFTHGHAQKWLNMTLKNMLVAETADWNKYLNSIRELLHVPVDQYVLSAADLQLGIRKKENKGKSKYTSEKLIGWSKWDSGTYEVFQEQVREAISFRQDYDCPIDWEFDAWIAYK
ncbi:MAG: hypothetical protein GX163_05400 [Bacteroidetes bacterium]|nr:hypothetical protein [Bacteroidota bacterium]